jgi:PPOX class probable F420-dependent enzyme
MSTIQSEQVAKLFKGKNFAHMATLMQDGSPQVTPVWIDVENGMILVNTAEGRTKQKNIARDPRIAISIADSFNPYNMVTVRGQVVEQTTKGADEHINKMAKKYLGLDKYPFAKPGEKRVLLKIKPDSVFHLEPR